MAVTQAGTSDLVVPAFDQAVEAFQVGGVILVATFDPVVAACQVEEAF